MEKSIFITGAGSGIGLDMVQELSGKGYQIFGTYISNDEKVALEKVSNVEAIKMDVTNNEEIDNAVDYVTQKLGQNGLYALVNNAGVQYMMPFECLDEEEGRKVAEINFFSIITISRKFLPLMKQFGKNNTLKPRIINTGSLAEYMTSPFNSYYSSFKQALNGLTETMYYDLSYIGIYASVANVGITKTPIADKNKAGILKNRAQLSKENLEIYGGFFDSSLEGLKKVSKPKGGLGIPSINVAKKMVKIIEAKKPRVTYNIGMDTKIMKFMKYYLPQSWKIALFKKMFGLK